MITVGFGDARLTRDGKTVYDGELEQREGRIKSWDDFMTFGQAAQLAAAEPDHDWRIVLEAPLWNETYQWQGKWVLVEKGNGFA
jgi:hypothetical protein